MLYLPESSLQELSTPGSWKFSVVYTLVNARDPGVLFIMIQKDQVSIEQVIRFGFRYLEMKASFKCIHAQVVLVLFLFQI